YVPLDFTEFGNTSALLAGLDSAVTTIKNDVRNLGNSGWQTKHAGAMNKLLDLVNGDKSGGVQVYPEKVLAGLLRVERTPIPKVTGTTVNATLTVCTVHGVSGSSGSAHTVAGAPVQLEFPLHHHARVVSGATNSSGVSHPDLLAPEDVTWDFA